MGHNSFDLSCSYVPWKVIKFNGFTNRPKEAIGIEIFEKKAVTGIVGDIDVADRIMDPAGIVGNR